MFSDVMSRRDVLEGRMCGKRSTGRTQGGHPPGRVREFHIGQGKVREIVVCLLCATAVVIVTK